MRSPMSIQRIEIASKKHKAIQLAGYVLMWLSGIFGTLFYQLDFQKIGVYSFLVLLTLGIFACTIAKILNWWDRGGLL